jgi:hypothetical protein
VFVLCGSQSKQRLSPHIALTGWCHITDVKSVYYTVRTASNIKQTCFIFKGLRLWQSFYWNTRCLQPWNQSQRSSINSYGIDTTFKTWIQGTIGRRRSKWYGNSKNKKKKKLVWLGAGVPQQTRINTVPMFTISPRSNLTAARRTYHKPPPYASYHRDGGEGWIVHWLWQTA